MEDTNIIGLIGSLFLTFCSVPELIRTFKTKKCHLGWGFLLMWLFGEILCLIYGFQLGELPMIINYFFNMLLLFIMIYYKFPNMKKSLFFKKKFLIFVKN